MGQPKDEPVPHEMDMVIPQWCFEILPPPDAEKLKKEEAERAAIDDIYHDTLDKHKILEQYPGMRATGPCNLIKAISTKVIENIRDNGGGQGIASMQDAMSLVEDEKDFNLYRVDHTVRMACESAVLNAFWRFVRHEEHVESPADLLSRWGSFKKERSHWWRAKRSLDSEEVVRQKWEALLSDSINLLHFHNVLLHTKCLLEKPTLKHTLHLSALTVEGRVYENGQGRSIASECRHIMVRKECNIPIKTRPDRKEPNSRQAKTQRTTVGPPNAGGGNHSVPVPVPAPIPNPGPSLGIARAPIITTVSPRAVSDDDKKNAKRRKLESKSTASTSSSSSKSVSSSDSSSNSRGTKLALSEPVKVKDEHDLTDDALSLLFLANTASSPQGQERIAQDMAASVSTERSSPSDTAGITGAGETVAPPVLMRADSSAWSAQLGEHQGGGGEVPVVSGAPNPFAGEEAGGINTTNNTNTVKNNTATKYEAPPLMRLTSKDWPTYNEAGGVPSLSDEVQSVFIVGKEG